MRINIRVWRKKNLVAIKEYLVVHDSYMIIIIIMKIIWCIRILVSNKAKTIIIFLIDNSESWMKIEWPFFFLHPPRDHQRFFTLDQVLVIIMMMMMMIVVVVVAFSFSNRFLFANLIQYVIEFDCKDFFVFKFSIWMFFCAILGMMLCLFVFFSF